MLPSFPVRTFLSFSKTVHFSVLQWNQLNSLLSIEPAFPKIPAEFLKWNYRKPLIEKELISSNADIICLEEVDQVLFYDEFFKNQGYSVVKGQKASGTADSVVIAFRNSKFKLIEQKISVYNENLQHGLAKHSQLFVHAKLQFGEKNEVWVYATHLKAKNFEEMRKVETLELMEDIKKYDSLKPEEKERIGIVVCGDFNAEPHYECMKVMMEGLDWVYKDAEYTTYKIRDKLYSRVIDYIFYGKESLGLSGKQEIPKKEEMQENGLPNAGYPSDHLSLLAHFYFKSYI